MHFLPKYNILQNGNSGLLSAGVWRPKRRHRYHAALLPGRRRIRKRAAGVMLCFFDGGGGMRVAVAWRLFMDQVDLMDQMDKMGAPWDNLRVCGAVGWSDSGLIYHRGMPGFFDGCGGVHVAGA